MTVTPNYMLVDDDGAPLGMVDPEAISTAGARLAFEFANACDDQDALNQITARYITEAGPAGFGYVATAALSIITTVVLSGVLAVTDALGTDMRTGIKALAEGRDPNEETK
ncbi:hypothetical protein EH165_09770 [Nakamurella antarctica]|uniref:Uncharacterized protein n=1 Tax=Nakamurella antarctica TaxID=1902245 RepID=A0A3G8ZV81_9ACTN|nr:hypothetical protein [Nakamurella antarctica]AZI58384.1 hypothetical protein EH165_09770 [Nakamurella antarctica]